MNSAYCLVGAFWDGKPATNELPDIEPFDATAGATSSADSLFDLVCRCRYLRLSDLLSCDSEQELDGLLDGLSGSENVYIALDWQPRSLNPAIADFFSLRERQTLYELKSKLPSCHITLMAGGPLCRSAGIRRMTMPWLIQMAEEFEAYLLAREVRFDVFGFPLVPSSCYASIVPGEMLPYTHRRSRLCVDASRAAICFFMSDRRIYPRFENLFDEIDGYRSYGAVVVPDLTVTADMDLPWQGLIMLLNQLFGAVLAINGIKIIANTRCGSPASKRYLEAIPKGVLCASGSLGCGVLSSKTDYGFLSKLLLLMPSASLIYGKRDPIAFGQFSTMGIPVKRYPDIHTRSVSASRNKSVA